MDCIHFVPLPQITFFKRAWHWSRAVCSHLNWSTGSRNLSMCWSKNISTTLFYYYCPFNWHTPSFSIHHSAKTPPWWDSAQISSRLAEMKKIKGCFFFGKWVKSDCIHNVHKGQNCCLDYVMTFLGYLHQLQAHKPIHLCSHKHSAGTDKTKYTLKCRKV